MTVAFYAAEIEEELQSDPRVHILQRMRGAKAVNMMAKALFFHETDKAASNEWMQRFTAAEKRGARLFIYTRRKRIHSDVLFKLAIRDSVVGHRFPLQEGLHVMEEIFRLTP